MLLLVALVIGLLAGIASGGRLGNLANVSLRWPWLVVAALIVREAAVFTPLNGIEGIQYVYVAALAALVAWTAWHASRLRGAWIGVPGPLGGAYSPGDVVIAIGIAAVAFFATRQGPAAAIKLDETSGRLGSYP